MISNILELSKNEINFIAGGNIEDAIRNTVNSMVQVAIGILLGSTPRSSENCMN